jgi:hypothetical protein
VLAARSGFQNRGRVATKILQRVAHAALLIAFRKL